MSMCPSRTHVALRLWPTERSSPLTPPSSAPSPAGGRRSRALMFVRQQTYPELARARRCRLVIVGVEVGGRFCAEARPLPPPFGPAPGRRCPGRAQSGGASGVGRALGWVLGGGGAARVCQLPFLELPLAGECCVGGTTPDLHEVLADARWLAFLQPSRLPLPQH